MFTHLLIIISLFYREFFYSNSAYCTMMAFVNLLLLFYADLSNKNELILKQIIFLIIRKFLVSLLHDYQVFF